MQRRGVFGRAAATAGVVMVLALCAGLGVVTPALAVPGDITTVAGTTAGLSGDGGLATAAQLSNPGGVAVTADGGFLIADYLNHRVRRVSPAGVITTAAGTTQGLSGDGGLATAAQLNGPFGVAVTADGGYLIADASNNRVRRVSPAGVITTAAGTTPGGFSGDGGPATLAQLSFPAGVAVTADGGYLIADAANNRVRRVSPAGVITTAAGTTPGGFSGDGGPATAAQLSSPFGVAVTADGGYLIADYINHRVRRVSPTGIITTAAGTTVGLSGDGGPAIAAQLNTPGGVAVTADGGYLIAATGNHRVRRVEGVPPPALVPPALVPPALVPPALVPPVAVPSSNFVLVDAKPQCPNKGRLLAAKRGARSCSGGPNGVIVLKLIAPGAGTFDAVATFKKKGRKGKFFTVTAKSSVVTYGTGQANAPGPGTVDLTIKPTSAGKQALKKTRNLQVAVRVSFRPVGGTSSTKDTTVRVKGKKKH